VSDFLQLINVFDLVDVDEVVVNVFGLQLGRLRIWRGLYKERVLLLQTCLE
jgi:hypothetical protein